MEEAERLALLKLDLQLQTGSYDKYLKHLLAVAEKRITGEGITLSDSVDHEALRIEYAAYLYRKRANPETTMPRSLRWALNNELFRQKGKPHDT